jgi:hypothetical protein
MIIPENELRKMSDEEIEELSIRTIAEALHMRALAADTDRGVGAYYRRAAYLIAIDRRLDERYTKTFGKWLRGECTEAPPITL